MRMRFLFKIDSAMVVLLGKQVLVSRIHLGKVVLVPLVVSRLYIVSLGAILRSVN